VADLLVHGLVNTFGKKRGRNGKKAGPPVHDDLVRRDFTATAQNRLWLADITEHRTTEGKLYLCAVKDACSNRIVGYSIGSAASQPDGDVDEVGYIPFDQDAANLVFQLVAPRYVAGGQPRTCSPKPVRPAGSSPSFRRSEGIS
jgi:hypothetical protein